MRIVDNRLDELTELRLENARLKEELEKARLKSENERIQKEINELEYPLYPYIPMPSPYRWPNVIYCSNLK